MSIFDQTIRETVLFRKLEASANRGGLSNGDVIHLTGIIEKVVNQIAPVLDRILLIFPQYTVHDIQHSKNILEMIGRFIPTATIDQLNGLELTFLILAGVLHDIGMFIADSERSHLGSV